MSTEKTNDEEDTPPQDMKSDDEPNAGGGDGNGKEGEEDLPTGTPVSGDQLPQDNETNDEGGNKGTKTPAPEGAGGGSDPPRRTRWSQDKDKTHSIPPRDSKRKKSPANLKSAAVKDNQFVQLVFKVASSQDVQAGFLSKLADFLTTIRCVVAIYSRPSPPSTLTPWPYGTRHA